MHNISKRKQLVSGLSIYLKFVLNSGLDRHTLVLVNKPIIKCDNLNYGIVTPMLSEIKGFSSKNYSNTGMRL